jgi:hypothetical protein
MSLLLLKPNPRTIEPTQFAAEFGLLIQELNKQLFALQLHLNTTVTDVDSLLGGVVVGGWKTISSASYTLLDDDYNKYLIFTYAGAVTVTVPVGVSRVGQGLTLLQDSAGTLTVVGDTAVVNGAPVCRGQHHMLLLFCKTLNVYTVVGGTT